MSSPRTTRLAPTPSGALHVGNARTFLVNWALARHEGWRIVLRLEDLDLGRVKPGAHESAIRDLSWIGVDWDGEPEVQSRDLAPYREALARLAARGVLFRCDRSRAEIRSAARAPHAEDGETRYPPELRPPQPWLRELGTGHHEPIDGEPSDSSAARQGSSGSGAFEANHRLLVEPSIECVDDEFLGRHEFNPGLEAGDIVVWTKLGVPAYQLAVVVDDARQGVTDVVRGDDLLASAARQQLIARHLGLAHARWWHVPLVYGDDGKRLAKRHGAHSLAQLRDDGVAAEAVIGWCAASLGLTERPRSLAAREFLALATPDALRTAMRAVRTTPTVLDEATVRSGALRPRGDIGH